MLRFTLFFSPFNCFSCSVLIKHVYHMEQNWKGRQFLAVFVSGTIQIIVNIGKTSTCHTERWPIFCVSWRGWGNVSVVKLPQKNNLKTVCTLTFLVNNTGYGERVSTSDWEDDRTGSSKIFLQKNLLCYHNLFAKTISHIITRLHYYRLNIFLNLKKIIAHFFLWNLTFWSSLWLYIYMLKGSSN